MATLDSISHYLSYTDYLPVINIPSGVVHLICGIRDKALLQKQTPVNENFKSLTFRKLDYSHIEKALAILSIFGTLLMWIKRILMAIELHTMDNLAVRAPKKLFSDKEWVEAAFKNESDKEKIAPCGIYRYEDYGDIFKNTSPQIKNSEEWILKYVDEGIFRPSHWKYLDLLKNNRRIVFAILLKYNADEKSLKLFKNLPENFRKDVAIINRTLACAKTIEKSEKKRETFSLENSVKSYLLPYIPSKDLYSECAQELALIAIRSRCCEFKDFSEDMKTSHAFCLEALRSESATFKEMALSLKSDPQFCFESLKINHRFWADLSEDMRKNSDLLTLLQGWFLLGWEAKNQNQEMGTEKFSAKRWVCGVLNDREWFQTFKQQNQQQNQAMSKDLVKSNTSIPMTFQDFLKMLNQAAH